MTTDKSGLSIDYKTKIYAYEKLLMEMEMDGSPEKVMDNVDEDSYGPFPVTHYCDDPDDEIENYRKEIQSYLSILNKVIEQYPTKVV